MKTTVVALAVMLFATNAVAATSCGKREMVEAKLLDNYGEKVVAMGINQRGLVEVWANPETGSWTITRTSANGVTCVLELGESVHVSVPKPPGRDM